MWGCPYLHRIASSRAHIGVGTLNSRPLPMKHLVICILSLGALIRHSIYATIHQPVWWYVYIRHLSAALFGATFRGTMAKGGEPTCKCEDWCFLWWRVQCGSYQDRLILTVGLPHHPPHPPHLKYLLQFVWKNISRHCLLEEPHHELS